ncbi:hypothetical protein C823_003327 [Eubacterium plexicaudatum ASF492]|uniref:Glycosyltransferase subfamily 4-like N-terminal domain-containing protein n=1 Tax=Eubacterium plexicaudatum ASF492 TaxID=1235802 RepID=N2AEE2_9FIRM|nr:hypothetical protein C823_003327 [Eubacterium plexicaudatum ASF492]
MLIEVDAQLFLDKEATGIAIYAGNMIRELWKCGHQIQYDIFEAKKIEQEVTNLKNSEHIEYSEMKKNIRICNKYSHRVYQWLSMFFPLRYSRLFGEDADVAIFFNYIVPPGVKAWKIAVIHDMSYLDCPKVVRWRTLFHLKYAMAASCRRADLILTVSEFSKRRIMKCLEVKEEKIEVVPCGIDFSCFCRKYAWKEIKQIKKSLGFAESIIYM